MKIESIILGPVSANCYLLTNEETGEVIVTDPGDHCVELIEKLRAKNRKPVAILLTHGHYDHITGVEDFRAAYPDIAIYAQEAERAMLEDPDLNMTHRWGFEGLSIDDFIALHDGEEFELIGEKIRAIHTPGHTAGGCCFYFPERKIMLTGDTLFCRSVGRTDLPTGDWEQLEASVRDKLYALPDDVICYPGHEMPTTIGEEKKENPFVTL